MLNIYNTLTKEKSPLKPIQGNQVKMYVCGITTYDYCHIGHARVMVCFDAIVRYLRYANYDVTYVRNITDVDDKIIKRAAENGETTTELTTRFIQYMHEDERTLNVLPPDIEPRATQHIQDIIEMVQTLIDKGFAYEADNHDVYFSVSSFPEYGKLSNKKLEDLLEGVRVQVEDAKRDSRDFALWKSAPNDEVSWDSPWGKGRPGWHIECSAMSTKCLGNHFDIHGGGPDLVFPHHENEIAQSQCATGEHYANVWMHAGAVRVDNEKMSKSLGNFFTIREVLEQYHPEVVRFFLLSSHYRSPINYSQDSLAESKKSLERLYTSLKNSDGLTPMSKCEFSEMMPEYYERFCTAMNDDFNTREGISVLFDLAKNINTETDANKTEQLTRAMLSVGEQLGVLQCGAEAFFKWQPASTGDSQSDDDIDELVTERDEAKKNKDYQRADEIRNILTEQGIVLEDTPQGTQWRRE